MKTSPTRSPRAPHKYPSGNQPFVLPPTEDDEPGFTAEGLLIVAAVFGGAFIILFTVIAIVVKCIERHKAKMQEREVRRLLDNDLIN
jgi:hypothetical protein